MLKKRNNLIDPNPTSIFGIEKALNKINVKSNAPVHLWNPTFCGNLDIRISRDGAWFYEGSKITRLNLVKLFSSILKKEGDNYFLVTPVEKIGIIVDDAPFVATSLDVFGEGEKKIISFTTHVGDKFTLSKTNPIRIEYNQATNEPSPYITVRKNLEALIDRKSFYRLIDLGNTENYQGACWFGLRSNETFFPLVLNDTLTD